MKTKSVRFWAKHDVTDYFDWGRAVQPSFPNLKPSTASISIRLPIGMLDELKALCTGTPMAAAEPG